MDRYTRGGKEFIGYEYKEVFVDRDKVYLYLDAYENFGWISVSDDIQASHINLAGIPTVSGLGKVSIKLKRNRKIINKTELTRLQRHFEACMNEVDELERSKTAAATMASIVIGVVGTAFMAGSTFAVTAEPPIIWLCVLLAVPGFIGWILPYFIYKALIKSKTKEIDILIEKKYDEIYEICKKGSNLL